MAALWRLEAASVEQVREALDPSARGVYNTTQTVLNRLAERGLLSRTREGPRVIYRPLVSEAQLLRQSIEQALADASEEARRTVLTGLAEDLDAGAARRLARLAARAHRR